MCREFGSAISAGPGLVVLVGAPGSGKTFTLLAFAAGAPGTLVKLRSANQPIRPGTEIDLVDDVDARAFARLEGFDGTRAVAVRPHLVPAVLKAFPAARVVNVNPMTPRDLRVMVELRRSQLHLPYGAFTTRALGRLDALAMGNPRRLDDLVFRARRLVAENARVTPGQVDLAALQIQAETASGRIAAESYPERAAVRPRALALTPGRPRPSSIVSDARTPQPFTGARQMTPRARPRLVLRPPRSVLVAGALAVTAVLIVIALPKNALLGSVAVVSAPRLDGPAVPFAVGPVIAGSREPVSGAAASIAWRAQPPTRPVGSLDTRPTAAATLPEIGAAFEAMRLSQLLTLSGAARDPATTSGSAESDPSLSHGAVQGGLPSVEAQSIAKPASPAERRSAAQAARLLSLGKTLVSIHQVSDGNELLKTAAAMGSAEAGSILAAESTGVVRERSSRSDEEGGRHRVPKMTAPRDHSGSTKTTRR